MRLQGLSILLVWFGCSYPATSTRRVAVLGYANPPRIVLVTKGPADLVKPWSADLRAAGTVEIVNEVPAPDAEEPLVTQPPATPTDETQPPVTLVSPDTAQCQLATDLASAGTPIDEIVELTTNETSERHDQCVKTRCTTPDLVGQGTSGEPQCDCVEHRYEGTTARASVYLRVVRAATCQLLRTRSLETPARTVASDPQSDTELAHRLVAELNAAAAVRETPDLFPNGNGILGVQGRSIEIRNDRDPLVPGAMYWLRGSRTGKGPRLRVVRADDRSATLEADLPPGDVEPGDELHVTKYVVRQTVYGALTGGHAVTSEGTYGQAGAAVTARWSFDRYPVVTEFGLTGDLLPRLDTARLVGGIAAGVRWPLGPIHPVGFGELGLGKAYQGDGYSATGGYVGAGAGIEVWLAGIFVFADVRWRRFWMQDWKNSNNELIVVEHPDLDTRAITGQIAVGRVF